MLDIRAPGGNKYVVAVHLKTKGLQDRDHVILREIRSKQAIDARRVKIHTLLLPGGGLYVDNAVDDLAGAEHLYELAGALHGGDGPLRIETLFEL